MLRIEIPEQEDKYNARRERKKANNFFHLMHSPKRPHQLLLNAQDVFPSANTQVDQKKP